MVSEHLFWCGFSKQKLFVQAAWLSELAKLLRNFCGTKHKIFLSLRISFARKNNNKRNHLQKSLRAKLPYSAFAKLKFCAIPQQEFCANPQFRNFVKIKRLVTVCVFLRIQFWKNLVLEYLPTFGHFYIIDQWQLKGVFVKNERGYYSEKKALSIATNLSFICCLRL